ncbi:MAG: cysteine desulfurase family protein, partial [Cyclobacteriaceae bacterium]
MRVYLDNAATTALDPIVLEAMMPFFKEQFGNPSSIHAHGREVRAAIEKSRKKIADLLNISPSELFFTSTGTEADNTALRCTVEAHGIRRIISTKIEHHAVLHTTDLLGKQGLEIVHLKLDDDGNFSYEELEELLKQQTPTLVSLMHANNEIGNLQDLTKTGELCAEYGALFHSDTVQTMGHYVHDFDQLKVDFAVGSAHKFHGPKGIGFLYINHETRINPFIYGGSQERNMRGGTENVPGIVGIGKALELAYSDMDEHHRHCQGLKDRMIGILKETIPDVAFNGNPEDSKNSLYTVLNVCLPPTDDNDMLLFNLDIAGVSCSGGSACTSGSNVGSHVLAELNR